MGAIISVFIAILVFIGLYKPEPPPCTQPITYRVGDFDKRFNLPYDSLIKALSQAESVWESASGLDLFTYASSTGELPVNLVYDYRQQATTELLSIENDVKSGKASYRTLQQQYQAQKLEYESQQSTYEARVASFNSQSDAYQKQVEEWNRGPRTNKEQFDALERARVALEQELSALKTQEGELHSQITGLNSLADRLNALAKDLNLDVDQYNAIGEKRGEEFTGGLYTRDQDGERIDIYEFSNHDKLVRVLSHELGHALGLEHVNDSKAVMYFINESQSLKLSGADIEELKRVCENI